jgi:phospholipid transport system substrate-binding protein
MSQAVVGRNYWQQASSSTQQQFVKEFTRYIIRTYASAMQSYDGETVKFYPIRGAVGSRVQIDSDLLLKSGPPIQMQYRLSVQSGRWIIYDFSVDGVSIIKNYNSQFASTLRQSGLSGLVAKLHDNNSRR